MTTVRAFAKRHPLPAYFALTFVISWGGVLALVAPGGIPGTTAHVERLLPFGILAMLVGPSVAGILMTGLVDGRAGLRELRSRLLRLRVGARWYAGALLIGPLLATATLFAVWLLYPEFIPGIVASDANASVLLFALASGLGAGFLEELGWTGFAVPRMRRRYSALTTGLIVGLLWGAWHFLTNFWGSGNSTGAFSPGLFLPATLFSVAALPAYRVLMVWVHDRTQSLFVAMLTHASLTAGWLILMPLAASGMPLLAWYVALSAALWIVVAALAAVGAGRKQSPLRRRIPRAASLPSGSRIGGV